MRFDNTAKRLRDALEKAGLTAKELSDKSGVSQPSISQYMNGSHCPSNINAGKIAKVLNVDPVWLMGFDVSKEEKTQNNPMRALSEEEELFLEALRNADLRARLEAYAILKGGKK